MASEGGGTSILDLPEPLTELLAEQVSLQSASLKHALVCHSWAKAATSKAAIRGVRLKSCSVAGAIGNSPPPSRLRQHERNVEIAGFELLEKLICDNCSSIPKEILSSAKLRTLHLKGDFDVLPPSFTELKCLQDCKLSSPSLRGLPQDIGTIATLRSLEVVCAPNCNYGEFTSIPASIGSLPELRRLVVKVGSVWSIPESFQHLRKLRFLILHTRMVDFPLIISKLTSLHHLDLRGDGVREVPSSYSSLASLVTLKLQGGQFTELPDFFGAFPDLKVLVLGSSMLRQLPPSLNALSKLQALVAADTQLEREANRSRIYRMRPIGVAHPLCQRDGSPQCTADGLCLALELPSLRVLRLCFAGGDDFVDKLPESIPFLTNLCELEVISRPSSLTNRRCSTAIDNSLGCLRSLQVLAIAGHSIPSIPSAISCLNLLKELVISDCSLHELPDSIGILPLLEDLCISSCPSLRSLPLSIGGLSSLISLELIFLPSIIQLPETLGDLSLLRRLSLVRLEELQTLPTSFTSLEVLEVLAIEGCWKLRSLPQDLGSLQSLQFLLLENLDSLSELPDSVGELGSLTELHLVECRSLHTLPDTLSGLVSLRKLESLGCAMDTVEPPVVERLKERIVAERTLAAEGVAGDKGRALSGPHRKELIRGTGGSVGKPLLDVKFDQYSPWELPPSCTVPLVRTQKAWTLQHRRLVDGEVDTLQGNRSRRNKKVQALEMQRLLLAREARTQCQYDLENDYVWALEDE